MLGLRTDQRGMFEADHLYLDYVGEVRFIVFWLASEASSLKMRSLLSSIA